MERHPRTYLCSLGVFLLGSLVVSVNATNMNNDGTLSFGDTPEGEGYSTPATFDEGSFPLPSTWNFIGNFLQTVSPGGPPYDIINDLLGNRLTIDVSLITENVLQYQRNLMGFAICFVIGLIFCLIFPIVGLCFCCCRCCCNNCGGKMHQDQSDTSCCKVVVFSLVLLTAIVLVFSGAVTALCISNYTGKQAANLATTVDNNINDLFTFVNNTLNEIDFLMTDQLEWTLDQVKKDLNDLGTIIGEPVREDLRANVQPAIDAVIGLETNIDFTLATLETINTRQASMEDMWENLSGNLTDLVNQLDTQCTSCSCCTLTTVNLRAVNVIADYRDLNMAMTQGSFPQLAVSASIVSLEGVSSQDLSAQAQEGAQTFEDIPETLTNTTNSDVADIIDTIDSLQSSLDGLINGTVSQLSTINDQVEPFQDTANNYLSTYADDYDKYRAYVMYCFYGFIIFVVALFAMGLLCGVFSYDSKVSPTSRGPCSHCGGLFLMSGAGIVFIFGMPFMLITSLTFVIGGPVDRLFCDPVVSGELFAETIDKPDAIIDGYYLGNALFQDSEIPITITGILEECKDNAGVYSAFYLENIFNASEFTDISSQIPSVDEQFANLTGDFSNINILTDDTKQTLVDFRDSPADTIDWTLFMNELAEDLLRDGDSNKDTLSFLITAIQSDAGSAPTADADVLNGLADDLQDVENNLVIPLLADKTLIAVEIDELTTYTDTIDSHVNNTINNTEVAQDYIDNNVNSLVATEVTSFSDQVIGYPEQFATYVTSQLQENVGGCRPVYNLWNQAINTICVGILRSFNGLWFTLGWCLFFFIFSLIFGIKLAKHFRRMDTTDGYSDQAVGFEMQGQQHYGNKVSPTSYDANARLPHDKVYHR